MYSQLLLIALKYDIIHTVYHLAGKYGGGFDLAYWQIRAFAKFNLMEV